MMITIRLEFYDKKTQFIADQEKMEFPYDMVLSAVEKDEYTGDELAIATAENQQIAYINCRPFDVSEEMKAYAIAQHPELKENFDSYLY